MWRAVNADGTLTYSFVEALSASHSGYVVRLIGGSTFAAGMLLMVVNCWLTIRQSESARESVPTAQPAQSAS